MQKTISSKIVALTFGVLAVSFLVAFYAVAWQEPGQTPPGGNVAAPLNISATAQTKEGDLTINGVLKTLKDMIVNVVTIKGNGSVSTNLNSDKVDDYHAADLLAQSSGSYRECFYDSVQANVDCPSGWTTILTSKGNGCYKSPTFVPGIDADRIIANSLGWWTLKVTTESGATWTAYYEKLYHNGLNGDGQVTEFLIASQVCSVIDRSGGGISSNPSTVQVCCR